MTFFFRLFLIFIGVIIAGKAQIAGSSSSATAPSPFYPSATPVETGTSVLMPDLEDVEDAVGSMMAFFNPSLRYQFQYGDGMPYSLGRQVKTSIHRLSPSIALRFAERFTFTYSPSLVWYSSDALEDRADHHFALSASGMTGDWGVGFSQIYADTTSPLLETGSQTRQKLWGTNASVGIPLGPRTSLEIGAGQYLRSTRDFTDVKTWSGSAWLRRKFRSTLNAGVGVVSTYNSIDPGRDLISQQVNGRVDWSPGAKLSVGFSGGVDISRFRDSDRGTLVNPVFAGNVNYQLLEQTQMSFSASRSVGASYYSNRLSESTGVSLAIRQRLLGQFYLRLGIARSTIDYVSATLAEASSERDDERWSYSASLSTQLLKKMSASLSWQESRNDSNDRDFAYHSSFIGFSLGWRY